MAKTSMANLRPAVRGVFDEESCRMYLQEIGSEIVPRYPFAYGIQKIYGILLNDYGIGQIADVVSLLHELLLDESYEGYIWRSWRHGWRHRNDDLLDPFVPAVDDFILPPPTRKCIRMLKGANFWAEERLVPSSTTQFPIAHDDDRPSYISNTSEEQEASVWGTHAENASPVEISPTQTLWDFQGPLDLVPMHNPERNHGINIEDHVLFHESLRLSVKPNTSKYQQRLPAMIEYTEPRNAKEPSTGSYHSQDTILTDDRSSCNSEEVILVEVAGDSVQVDSPELLVFELMDKGPRSMAEHTSTLNLSDEREVLRPICSDNTRLSLGENPGSASFAQSDWAEKGSQKLQEHLPPYREREDSHVQKNPLVDLISAVILDGAPESERLVVSSPETVEGLIQDQASAIQMSGTSLWTAPPRTIREDYPCFVQYAFDDSCSKVEGVDHLPLHAGTPSAPPSPSKSSRDHVLQSEAYRHDPYVQGEGHFHQIFAAGEYHRIGSSRRSAHTRASSMFSEVRRTPPTLKLRRSRSLSRHVPENHQPDQEGKQILCQTYRPDDRNLSSTEASSCDLSKKTGCSFTAHSHSSSNFDSKSVAVACTSDSSGDEIDTPSVMTGIDLNKALPLKPPCPTGTKRLSTLTTTPSLTFSYETNTQPSLTSVVSAGISRVSSKRIFQHTAHQLAHPGMPRSLSPPSSQHVDSDKYLIAAKYDPLASPKMPDTPVTFSSFQDLNPYMSKCKFTAPIQQTPTLEPTSADTVMGSNGPSTSQSRSEVYTHSGDPSKILGSGNAHPLVESDGIEHAAFTHSADRGRTPYVTQSSKLRIGGAKARGVCPDEPRKRSRSPVKRLLGLAKIQSSKDIAHGKDLTEDQGKKAGLRMWGDRLRHGFMTNPESSSSGKATPPRGKQGSNLEDSNGHTFGRPSGSISIPPLRQAKLYCEIELMICVTANKFLKAQQRAGLMSAESVSTILAQWSSKDRPQVHDFQFDQATQRELILHNISTLNFSGDARKNAIFLNATMYAWKVMAKEMGVRTFCTADSVIRKHLHDTHKVLEMLGAGLATFLALQEIQVSALTEMAEEQKKKLEQRNKRSAVGEGVHGNGIANKKEGAGDEVGTSKVVLPALKTECVDEEMLLDRPG